MNRAAKIVLLLAILGFLACMVPLMLYFWTAQRDQQAFDVLQRQHPVYSMPESWAQEEEPVYQPDCIGWVTIEDTRVNYPVMQRPDSPEYYLRRNFYGEYSPNGTPFLDAACSLQRPGDALYIYGHHTKTGMMFTDLLEYRQPEFLAAHPTVLLETADGVGEYQIFAVCEISSGYDELGLYDMVDLADSAAYEEFVTTFCDVALYDTGVIPEGRILVLITCTTTYDNSGRFYLAAHQTDFTPGESDRISQPEEETDEDPQQPQRES